MAFERRTELFVGIFKDNATTGTGTDGFLVDGLDYEFDVVRSSEYYKDSATFTIYNPSEDTIQEIMTRGVSVIFKVGYSDEGMGIAFVGQIATAYPEEDKETKKIILICTSQRGAQYPLQRTMISATFAAGRSYYDVLKSIADYVGVPLSGAELLKDKFLKTAYIINGDVRSETRLFVGRKLRCLGYKLIISNNEMILLNAGDYAVMETAYLTYKTGLVSVTPIRDDRYQSSEDAFQENQEYYLGLKNKPDKKEDEKVSQVQPKNAVEFCSIINPAIEVGKPIFVDSRKSENDSRSVVGRFYVTELHLQGDNFGGRFEITGKAEEK